jgi:hypothetical protein
MRFLRGLGLGILGFFIWIVTSIIGALVFLGAQGLGTEFELGLLFESSPIVAIFLVAGFGIMFLGPIFYWIIEPILKWWKGGNFTRDQLPFAPGQYQEMEDSEKLSTPTYEKMESGVKIEADTDYE